MEKTLEKLCEEAISICVHTRCSRCEYGGRTLLSREGQRCQGKLLADYLRKCGVVVQRWIPVEERLPEKGTYLVCKAGFGGARYLDVLSFVEDLYRLDEYDFRCYAGQKKAGFVYYDSEYGYCEAHGVTHWMPLPEPPKEVE